jgi:hypothetical protein
VPAGNYSLSFLPSDSTFFPEYRNAAVALGQITVVDTVKFINKRIMHRKNPASCGFLLRKD